LLRQFYNEPLPDSTLLALNDYIIQIFIWLLPYASLDILADILPPVAAGVIYGEILKLDQAGCSGQTEVETKHAD